MVYEFYSLIERIKSDLELELSRIPLIQWMIIRRYMPLIVNFNTEHGSASFIIRENRSIIFNKWFSKDPDNTINTTFEILRNLYYSRDKEKFLRAEREGKIRIISHTPKGKKAEMIIRKRFGG